MSQPVISVENLGKRYFIGHQVRHDTLRDRLAYGARGLLQRWRNPGDLPAIEEFWALHEVSFQVNQGDVVGIIGRNGAGKSTLLKILSRITEPTTGRATIRGRVASLLEVGTGFHPELTGRENIFLNGAILGMTRAEIRRKFDEIVAFAEVERFLDTPVKHYSSGMYVRLAFAVAAHLEPEILIVDEVLAVGDAEFQKRCLGKMDAVARSGRTVLLVSHNLGVVSSLCHSCVFLQEGMVEATGPTAEVMRSYLQTAVSSDTKYTSAPGSQLPTVTGVEVLTDETGLHVSGAELAVRFTIHNPDGRRGICLSFQVLNHMQQPVVHAWIYDPEQPFCRSKGETTWICRLPSLHLNVGLHTLRVYLSEPPGGRLFATLDGICGFEVSKAGPPPLFGYRPESCAYLAPFVWAAT